MIQIFSGTSLSLVLRQGSSELEEYVNRLLQDYMSSISKLIEKARKHILEIHDFCSFFSMVEEQMSHVNSLLDESEELYERLLAMRREFVSSFTHSFLAASPTTA